MVRLGNYIFIEEKEMTEQVHKRLIDEQVKMILLSGTPLVAAWQGHMVL